MNEDLDVSPIIQHIQKLENRIRQLEKNPEVSDFFSELSAQRISVNTLFFRIEKIEKFLNSHNVKKCETCNGSGIYLG